MQEDMLLAESLLRQGLAIRERMNPPAPRSDLAESQVALSRLLLATARADEARPIAAEASVHCREAFGPMHLRTLNAMHLRADTLAATERTAESDRVQRCPGDQFLLRSFECSRRISMYSQTSVTISAKAPYHSRYLGAPRSAARSM